MLRVDTGCLAARASTVHYDVVTAGGVKTMIFGGEGVFFARLRGPGHVWLQSLPFSRLAGRIMANMGPGGPAHGRRLGARCARQHHPGPVSADKDVPPA